MKCKKSLDAKIADTYVQKEGHSRFFKVSTGDKVKPRRSFVSHLTEGKVYQVDVVNGFDADRFSLTGCDIGNRTVCECSWYPFYSDFELVKEKFTKKDILAASVLPDPKDALDFVLRRV